MRQNPVLVCNRRALEVSLEEKFLEKELSFLDIHFLMQQLSRSLSRLETQDIKTQPQFNHYFIHERKPHLEDEYKEIEEERRE